MENFQSLARAPLFQRCVVKGPGLLGTVGDHLLAEGRPAGSLFLLRSHDLGV